MDGEPVVRLGQRTSELFAVLSRVAVVHVRLTSAVEEVVTVLLASTPESAQEMHRYLLYWKAQCLVGFDRNAPCHAHPRILAPGADCLEACTRFRQVYPSRQTHFHTVVMYAAPANRTRTIDDHPITRAIQY